MRKCSRFLVAAFGLACICNIYLISLLWTDSNSNNTVSRLKTPENLVGNKKSFKLNDKITRIEKLALISRNINIDRAEVSLEVSNIITSIKSELATADVEYKRDISIVVSEWVKPHELLPDFASALGYVVSKLKMSTVEVAEVSKKGTQLKVLLTLEDNVKVLFKPQWYNRSAIIEGSVYSGKDRHNAEIVAFYLSLLLNLRRTPIAVGRRFNLKKEIWSKAEAKLAATFFRDGTNNTCFYGVCYYCHKEDAVCGEGDSLEGAVILWLPTHIQLKKYRSPWQRTYKDDAQAMWQSDESYCERVQNQSSVYRPSSGSRRLLDLVETSVFDFLMSNGDRHHYEIIDASSDPAVLLIDNGKSFGRPDIDYLDILAPLYQCCVIREAFVRRLQLFQQGRLSAALDELSRLDLLYPLLTGEHLSALDRRLAIVLEAVQLCRQENADRRIFY